MAQLLPALRSPLQHRDCVKQRWTWPISCRVRWTTWRSCCPPYAHPYRTVIAVNIGGRGPYRAGCVGPHGAVVARPTLTLTTTVLFGDGFHVAEGQAATDQFVNV